MSSAISREELETVFGADHLATVPADRLNAAVTHEPTAAFLTGTGLPDMPDFLFYADEEIGAGLEGALERQSNLGDFTDLPADGWVVIGYFWDDAILLDGATGEIRVFNDPAGIVQFMNSGLDLFVRFLAAIRRDWARISPESPSDVRKTAADNLLAELRAVDPAAFADSDAYWYKAIDNAASEY